ncbi:hypothetical protein PAXRUDRAFT_827441 [Paxillus rubicundulus Ve08.2h10]|uniref:Uncharacterized protein n=1 Tax=Paxillus rubicundulus Ve08.2h10 TaxID=930991 RepID=A0A0D0DQU2_9AGAM|nr:hypothetical protein PAXRUDRAFT_827441 [Paxillus rubicundulus Ve08.2h10]
MLSSVTVTSALHVQFNKTGCIGHRAHMPNDYRRNQHAFGILSFSAGRNQGHRASPDPTSVHVLGEGSTCSNPVGQVSSLGPVDAIHKVSHLPMILRSRGPRLSQNTASKSHSFIYISRSQSPTVGNTSCDQTSCQETKRSYTRNVYKPEIPRGSLLSACNLFAILSPVASICIALTWLWPEFPHRSYILTRQRLLPYWSTRRFEPKRIIHSKRRNASVWLGPP